MVARTRTVGGMACPSCLEWRERFDRLLEQYQALTMEMLRLKRDGFVQPYEPGPPPEPRQLPAEIEAAIQEITEPGTPTDRQLRAFAWAQLGVQADPAQVAVQITKGEEV